MTDGDKLEHTQVPEEPCTVYIEKTVKKGDLDGFHVFFYKWNPNGDVVGDRSKAAFVLVVIAELYRNQVIYANNDSISHEKKIEIHGYCEAALRILCRYEKGGHFPNNDFLKMGAWSYFPGDIKRRLLEEGLLPYGVAM